MKKLFLVFFTLAWCSVADADQPLVRQIQQSGFAQKVHPQLLQKLAQIPPTQKIAVWVRLHDRPDYRMQDLPSWGYLPPMNEQYISTAKNIPGAEFLGTSELTNEVSVLIPASSVVNAIRIQSFTYIEESPRLELEGGKLNGFGQREIMEHPNFSTYQGVSYNKIEARPLQEATWGGYDWDSTNATAKNKHRKIAILDTGIWPYHPAFWLSEKPLSMTGNSSPIVHIAAADSFIHLLPGVGDSDSLFYMRSRDYGFTWDSLKPVITLPDTESISLARIAASSGSGGSYVMVPYIRSWASSSGYHQEVYVRVSTDGGETWGTPTLLYTKPSNVSTANSYLAYNLYDVTGAISFNGGVVEAYVFWHIHANYTWWDDFGSYSLDTNRVVARRFVFGGSGSWEPQQEIWSEVTNQATVWTSYSVLDASAKGTYAHVSFAISYTTPSSGNVTRKVVVCETSNFGPTWAVKREISLGTTSADSTPVMSAPQVATIGGNGHVVYGIDSSVYYFSSGNANPPLSLSNVKKVFSVVRIAASHDSTSMGGPRDILHVVWVDHRDTFPNVFYKRHRNGGDAGTAWDDGDEHTGNNNADITRKLSFNREIAIPPGAFFPLVDIIGLDEIPNRISTVHVAWFDYRMIGYGRWIWYTNSSKICNWKDYETPAKSKPSYTGGHGTGVTSGAAAGIVAVTNGGDGQYNPLMGIAYNTLLAIARYGTPYEGNVIEGIKWAMATAHADVINISSGQETNPRDGSHRLTQYVDWATGMGTVVCVSKTYISRGGIGWPDDNFNAITVGASNRAGTAMWEDSGDLPPQDDPNRYRPDIVAPGKDIYMARPPENANGGFYNLFSGTSHATPMVTGLSSMLIQAHPDWTPGAIRKALRSNASNVPGGGAAPNNWQGWGLVKANATNGFNPAPFPPSILPTAIDVPISAAQNTTMHLRSLIKPNGGVDVVYATAAAFGEAISIPLSDSGVIGNGWHVYTANYSIPSSSPTGNRFVKVTAYKSGAGAHDTVRAYINLNITPGAMPFIIFKNNAFNFGGVFLDSIGMMPLWIYNVGDSSLTIDSMKSTDSRFSVSPTSGTIAVSDSQEYQITFSPDSTMSYSADLIVYHNADSSPDTISLTGTGICGGCSVTIANAVSSGWNMISIPINVSDQTKTTLFPSATSAAFAYAGMYVQKDTLEYGEGYWLKFDSADTISTTGTVRDYDSIDVLAGWNMIGSISLAVPTSAVAPIGTSIVSNFFGYTSGYSVASSIEPAKAYWVKVSSAGQLVLSSSNAISKSNNTPHATLDNFNSLTITDASGKQQTLYFGMTPDKDSSSEHFELPPSPPAGVFDVRFMNNQKGYFAQVHDELQKGPETFTIALNNVHYPVKVQWSLVTDIKNEYHLADGLSGTLLYTTLGRDEKGNLKIYDTRITSLLLRISSHAVPQEFVLHQNYPNPFNPTTAIRFDVPIATRVTLKIYNLLGQEVKVIAEDKLYEAGRYEEQFDASTLASGMYYYSFNAQNTDVDGTVYQSVKTMVLIR